MCKKVYLKKQSHIKIQSGATALLGYDALWLVNACHLSPVWPVKNRQIPIKVAQKWFH